MSALHAASCFREGAFSAELVLEAANELRRELVPPSPCAFAFFTPDYAEHAEEFSEILRVDGHITNVAACTASGITGSSRESEKNSGFSVLAFSGNGMELRPLALSQSQIDQSDAPEFWRNLTGHTQVQAWMFLANPFVFSTDDWLPSWNRAFPEVPCLGGLASGGRNLGQTGVFLNGESVDALVVGVSGQLEVVPVVSQGCRPIGEPLTVTRAEDNIVYILGSRPAYEALETAYQTLTEAEKSRAQGNLFAGLAGTEYVEEFKSGDFLVRNIIGADPNSGAVVIAGIPRIGQTLQYQLRDKSAAHEAMGVALNHCKFDGRKPLAALLFSCLGRGEDFFGSPRHDADALKAKIGDHPLAGFYCNGEIGPLAGVNCLHGYTAACAIFVEKNSV